MNKCKHVAFTLVDSKVFDNDGTEIGCTGGGLIKCTDCETTVFNIQQENIQLKSDLQALRELIKEVEWAASSFDPGFCPACGSYNVYGHIDRCWLKAELDQLKGVE